MKQILLKTWLVMLCMLVGIGSAWGEEVTATLNFGTNYVKIDKANVTANDDKNNEWTITTTGTTSFTQNAAYSQVGSSSKPATSITFVTTFQNEVEITSIDAAFGGFSGTAGNVVLKVDDDQVGTGSLNATDDVVVSAISSKKGKKISISVTGIAKGVKCFNIEYKYKTNEDPATPTVTAPTFDVAAGTYTEDQLVLIDNYDSNYLYAYTLDGTNPAFDENLNIKNGTEYDNDEGIEITSSCTLKVIAVDEEGNASSITSATYVINKPFASLEDLVAADIATGTTVTVSFENVAIKSFQTVSDTRKGVYFGIQKGGKDIEIYFNSAVPAEWVEGGTLSGTMTCPWKLYSGTWELAPASDWAWTNLTYTAPTAEQYSYTLETIGQGSVEFKDANNNTIAPNQKVDKGTKIYPTFTPSDGYKFTSWEYWGTSDGVEQWKPLAENTTFTISKDVKFRVTFTETQQGGDEPTPGEGETYTFTGVTANDGKYIFTSDNFTIEMIKGSSSSTPPAWTSSQARLYAGGTLVVTSEKNIVKVVYDYIVNANKNNVTPTIDGAAGKNDAGTWDASAKTWTGKDTEVTLTTSGSAGNLGFKSITVYFEEESTPENPTITISAAGYATYYNDKSSVILPEGMTASVWERTHLQQMYVEGATVPAGEPVVLKAAPGTYTLVYTDHTFPTMKSIGQNDLCGAATDMTAVDMASANPGDNKFYALSLNAANEISSVGFYWVEEEGAAFDIPAGKAYLVLPKSSASSKGYAFIDDEITAVNNIDVEKSTEKKAYNLAGQRVNANLKGIVIMNGKKFINK